MIQFTIHGRGGRGGVTLAKLIAGAYFLQGKYVQAFGLYGAERTGAPVQAFVRVDDSEIVRHGPVTSPDYVTVIDPSLISPDVTTGLSEGGWIILNTPSPPDAFTHVFPGRRVVTVDANEIATAHRLGSDALPVVNTTMLGAIGRILGLHLASIDSALAAASLEGGNVAAAHEAFERVRSGQLSGTPVSAASTPASIGPAFTGTFAGTLPTTRTGDWASSRPRGRELPAVCGIACPAGNDSRGFIQAAVRGNYDLALAILLWTSPFPGTCGRVCPAPCMTACNRTHLDEPVNIRDLERAVADRGRWPDPVVRRQGECVAVVGGGPAGLSAAYHLARGGHRVTVFEASAEIGGLLRHGIPPYRLPRRVLDREIDFILQHDVRVETEHPVNDEELLRLSADFSRVFLAPGLQQRRAFELPGRTGCVAVQGLEFLEQARREELDLTGDRVVVVGGGNTAVDAARTARRLGADDVRVLYRRTRSEMPASAEEVQEALEEGVGLDQLAAPVELIDSSDGHGLVCRRMKLAEPDESGRPRPVPVEGDGALMVVGCDRLILALGQSPDESILPDGAERREGRICTQGPGRLIFAGGDFATLSGTVVAAVGSGRSQAAQIHADLGGVLPPQFVPMPAADLDAVTLSWFPRSPQHRGALLAAERRRRNFAEVRLGIRNGSDDLVAAEAGRCLSCGSCNGCDTCSLFCPEGVVRAEDDCRCHFDYEYCKGCGLCAAICPRGAIAMNDHVAEVCR